METTPFDTRSSQNLQKGLAPLMKGAATLSMPAVQFGGSALFADMLEQKISQSNLQVSTSDPATAALDGKSPAFPTSKRLILKGYGEAVVAGKGKQSANVRSLSSTSNSEPLKGIDGEVATEIVSQIPVSETERSTFGEALAWTRPQPVMASFLREDALHPLTGLAGMKSVSLNEKMESIEEPKTVTPLATEMNHAKAIPASGENVPHTEPSPTENATRPIAPRHEPGTVLFMQAIKPQGMEHLEREGKEPPAGKTILKDAPAFTSREFHTQSARHADPRSSLEGADRRTEPAFMQRAAEIPQREKGVAAPEGVPAKNPTASAPAAPAAFVSHEIRPQSARHADPRSSLEGADRRTEPAFMQRAAETLRRKKEGAAPDSVLLDVRQAGPSRHDHSKRAGVPKEGAGGAAVPHKPTSAVSNGDTAIGQVTPERMTVGGSSDKTFSIMDTVMETPGLAHDHAQRQTTTPHHQTRLSERDIFPFRMEMPNVVSSQGTRIPAAVGASGIEMQAVIDHILETRQGASNNFGRVRILLNPPDLGAIDLDIVVRRERVEVVMTADNATVQQALQSRSDDIRMALHRHDLKMEGFQVLLQDNGTSQQQANNGAMYREDREHREHMERFNIKEDGQPAVPVLSAVAGEKSAAGLVSIFA